jgi:hypothetical protein
MRTPALCGSRASQSHLSTKWINPNRRAPRAGGAPIFSTQQIEITQGHRGSTLGEEVSENTIRSRTRGSDSREMLPRCRPHQLANPCEHRVLPCHAPQSIPTRRIVPSRGQLSTGARGKIFLSDSTRLDENFSFAVRMKNRALIGERSFPKRFCGARGAFALPSPPVGVA